MIRSTVTIYLDPWKIGKSSPRADIILLTHDHHDHYSESDIQLVSDASTRIIAPMTTRLTTDTISPGENIAVGDVSVRAVPAYNIGKAFHPRTNAWVGYLVEVGGKKIYHPGDTDRIPEMKQIQADLAFLPVGGTYTMDAQEAGGAAGDIAASLIVPIHFGDIVGSRRDAERLAGLCPGRVRILQPGETISLD
jgi:L-ascorbate metabolism protein UlaG (beta-lactamase superfamily)